MRHQAAISAPQRGIRVLLACSLGFLCGCCSAQAARSQTQQPSAASSTPQSTKASSQSGKSEEEKAIERKEQSRRVLGVVPDFGVTNRQNASPLTPHEKFHLFVKYTFDPVTIGVVGVQAALSQSQNEFPAYGQGAQGYGKRFGASMADNVSASFWTGFAYPTLLKEDPRYFRLGEGGFGHRFLYGLKQQVVCHTDDGGRSFNFSNVLGSLTTGAVSNIYYPGNTLIRTIPATSTSPAIPVYEDDRGVVLTLSRTAVALGYGAIGGLFDEFWPDVHDRLFRKRAKERVPSN